MPFYIYINEEWKSLVYKDIKPMYLISNYGRVKNINTDNFITISKSEKGYCMMSLMSNSGKQKTYKLHRLVAYTFLQLPDFSDGRNWTVNHIDGNKDRNWASNLEWVTFSDNIQHAFRTGLNKGMKGESNGNNKYSEDVVHLICSLMERGLTNRQIKRILFEEYDIKDINRFFLYDLRHRNVWNHVTQLYRY